MGVESSGARAKQHETPTASIGEAQQELPPANTLLHNQTAHMRDWEKEWPQIIMHRGQKQRHWQEKSLQEDSSICNTFLPPSSVSNPAQLRTPHFTAMP